MGYTTDFRGSFDVTFNDESKKQEVIDLVNGLASTRRVKRDLSKIQTELTKSPKEYGVEGEFFYGGTGFAGQDNDASVINGNQPPSTQPGLWLQWILTDMASDGEYVLEWDGGEKFYEYVAWLDYLVEKIFAPNNVVLNGEVEWRGEEWDDTGTIMIEDNVVSQS